MLHPDSDAACSKAENAVLQQKFLSVCFYLSDLSHTEISLQGSRKAQQWTVSALVQLCAAARKAASAFSQ
ncbi:MAG: hypothetical protein AAGJ36_00225, partial [Pseudomonadota bacterium]